MVHSAEKDALGNRWVAAPYSTLDQSLAEVQEAYAAASSNRADGEAVSGLKLRVPADLGTGKWQVVIVSPYITVMSTNAMYHEDHKVHVADDRTVKVRILLRGKLTQLNLGITLEGTGAFVEAYPGDVESNYVIHKDEPTRLVILNLDRRYFSEVLGLKPEMLPQPLVHAFAERGVPTKGGIAPLGPDMLRGANDVIRAFERFSGPLLTAYLGAKGQEIACAMISDLHSRDRNPLAAGRSSVRDIRRIDEARDILRDQFKNPPNIPVLARQVGVNQTKLKALFKSVYGITIHEFTQKCRMDSAIDLLMTSDHTIAEVAYAVGYDYPASFTNAFRKFYGHSPRQARQARSE